MPSTLTNRQRAAIRGARIVGWRSVWLRTDLPHDLQEPWGTLAEPAQIRGIDLPAGSTIAVNPDFDDITVKLAGATTVRGIALPAGTTLTFRGRVVGFPGLRLSALLLLAIPYLLWRQRRDASVIEALIGQDLDVSGRRLPAGSTLAIRIDGSIRADPDA